MANATSRATELQEQAQPQALLGKPSEVGNVVVADAAPNNSLTVTPSSVGVLANSATNTSLTATPSSVGVANSATNTSLTATQGKFSDPITNTAGEQQNRLF